VAEGLGGGARGRWPLRRRRLHVKVLGAVSLLGLLRTIGPDGEDRRYRRGGARFAVCAQEVRSSNERALFRPERVYAAVVPCWAGSSQAGATASSPRVAAPGALCGRSDRAAPAAVSARRR
jgi:hypothetical protein